MTEISENKPTILVVDDSRLMRLAAKKILRDDFEVVEAVDGEDAWEVLQNNLTIDLVMSDLSMPNLDGLGLLKNIRYSEDSRTRQLPVIILTGAEDDDGSRETAMSAGASDFITKPFKSAQLIEHAQAQIAPAVQPSNEEASIQIPVEMPINTAPVTKLLDANEFRNRLDESISCSNRHGNLLCVALIRVDRYNVLFLRQGKAAAESLLHKISDTISSEQRHEDVIGQIEPGTFAVLLPETSLENGYKVADQLFFRIKDIELLSDGQPIPFGVSIAVDAIAPHADDNAAQLLGRIHAQLVVAMKSGGNQIVGRPSTTAIAPAKVPAFASADEVQRALLALASNQQPDTSAEVLARSIMPLLENWAASCDTETAKLLVSRLIETLNRPATPSTLLKSASTDW